MPIFDITSAENAMQSIVEFTGVPVINILAFLNKHIVHNGNSCNATALTGENFIHENGLDVAALDVSCLNICALHYTSNDDHNESLLVNGLGDLQYSLTNKTPLKNYLSEYDIEFDINNCTMTIGNTTYDINYSTEYDEPDSPIAGIARKIFYDNGLSCFLFVEDISRYLGHVHMRPEILYNIEQLCTKLDLSQNWAKRCKSYEVKFASHIDLFEDYSFRDDDRPFTIALLDHALCIAGEVSNGEDYAYLSVVNSS
jgi:hypothetical protein